MKNVFNTIVFLHSVLLMNIRFEGGRNQKDAKFLILPGLGIILA